jgi:hypothetical protein
MFLVQSLCNPAGTLARGVPSKYPSNFARLSLINFAPTGSGFSSIDVPIAFSTGASTVKRQSFECAVRSMSNLAQFLLCHCALDGDENVHADNACIDAIVGDDMHVEVFEFLLDRMHF